MWLCVLHRKGSSTCMLCSRLSAKQTQLHVHVLSIRWKQVCLAGNAPAQSVEIDASCTSPTEGTVPGALFAHKRERGERSSAQKPSHLLCPAQFTRVKFIGKFMQQSIQQMKSRIAHFVSQEIMINFQLIEPNHWPIKCWALHRDPLVGARKNSQGSVAWPRPFLGLEISAHLKKSISHVCSKSLAGSRPGNKMFSQSKVKDTYTNSMNP